MATGTKTGGRTKGTPNRTTAETKELLQTIVSKELDKLGAMLEQLEPNERINAIAKLLPYILPKQNEVKAEITNTDKNLTSEEREKRISELIKKAKSIIIKQKK
ncbi:hypothetical protein FPG101_00885 [Flavobacterium psychrophilum FPG101]|uniref:hypothetical protein n=1 Tax=Flavobacterium psychrophilum TaxID=96345 RepID=UPI0004E7C102|nr:hypothetical protein [Flavobacterium psychrophilum]AIJ36658.1 hypothetical protein FPSM_00163 [Flavobacterium psychrophilum]AIN70676.1 hypothetical protein FPG101_00885 [Flavobacterium psychrophilum FPG101]EKT3974857.1 hypothetical protein [Flavobacterium psychrophilum]EKT4537536.1 hypothetical protein [Flavobacterium psychrophilum]EKT4545772.1 hypothetical protein [Flavobacterium psychrophilum]